MALFGTAAELQKLAVELNLVGNFSRSLGRINKDLNKFDSRIDKSQSKAYQFGQHIGIGIRRSAYLAAGAFSFLAGNVALGLNSLIDLEQQVAQTNAVLKSTKQIAGVTAATVGTLAEKFESLNATIGDEVIRSAENMLLTFTNVRKRAFEPALSAILDLNTALGRGEGGLTQTALQVGKALQDPIKGMIALRRAGVSFTDAQIKKIKSLVKEGKLYQAQTLILRELNKEFGGSFAKQGATTAGRIAKFRDSIDDLQRALAKALLPTLGNVADALSKTLADPAVIKGVEDFGKSLATLVSGDNLAKGAQLLGSFIKEAKDAAPGIIAGAKIAGQVVATAVKAFQSLPPDIQRIAIGALAVNKLTGGIVTNLAGGLISAVLKQLVTGVVNVTGATVIVNGGVGGPGGVPVGGSKPGEPAPRPGAFGPAIGAAVALDADEAWRIAKKAADRLKAAADATANKLQDLPSRLGAFPPPQPNQPRNLPPGHDVSLSHDQLTAIKEQTALTVGAIRGLDPKLDQIHTGFDHLVANMSTEQMVRGWAMIEDRRGANEHDDLSIIKETELQTSALTQTSIRAASDANAARLVGATQAQTAAIVSTIWAARPIVNVTNVTRTTTIQNRYGPSNGSYGQTSGH